MRLSDKERPVVTPAMAYQERMGDDEKGEAV